MPAPLLTPTEIYRLSDAQVEKCLSILKGMETNHAYRTGKDTLSHALGEALEDQTLRDIEDAAAYRSPDPRLARGLVNAYLASKSLGRMAKIEWDALTRPWTDLFV